MLLLLLACVPTLPGTWLAGDLHVHSSLGSNDTDGLGTPEALGRAMDAAGLDFVFVTDHSNSAGSMDCADVEDCPNRGPEFVEADWPAGVWPGSEISPIASLDATMEPTGHTGCLSDDPSTFAGAFVDRPPGEVSGGEALAQCLDVGGWAVVNHPYAAAGWIAYDWTSEGFDAIEVYNGGARFDPWDAQGVEAWEERVAAGRDLVPVGGSDCHRFGTEPPGDLLNPALGWPRTRVRLLEGETVLDGLRAGRTVVVEPGTELSLVASHGLGAAGPGESIAGPATLRARASSGTDGLLLELKEVGGDVLASEPLAGSAGLELRVDGGRFYARVWPADPDFQVLQGGVGMTAAVTVEAR